jgi:hypothetical protein
MESVTLPIHNSSLGVKLALIYIDQTSFEMRGSVRSVVVFRFPDAWSIFFVASRPRGGGAQEFFVRFPERC